MTCDEIMQHVSLLIPPTCRDRWVWITGGEPLDHELRPLIKALRKECISIAVASAGHHRLIPPVDWMSISPHDPARFLQTYGNELKLVEGLHGMDLKDFLIKHPDDETDFMYRYVQPMSRDGLEDEGSFNRCMEFLKENPNWALSRQDQYHWSVE